MTSFKPYRVFMTKGQLIQYVLQYNFISVHERHEPPLPTARG